MIGAKIQPLWVEIAEILRSSLPHVEECTIDGVGHLLHIQRPEPVARRMAVIPEAKRHGRRPGARLAAGGAHGGHPRRLRGVNGIVPADHARLATRRARNANLIEIENLGHDLHLEQPERW